MTGQDFKNNNDVKAFVDWCGPLQPPSADLYQTLIGGPLV